MENFCGLAEGGADQGGNDRQGGLDRTADPPPRRMLRHTQVENKSGTAPRPFT